MLTIHGVARSRASRIIWLCHELGLPFLHRPVIQAYRLADAAAADAPPNTRSADFLALSPAGAVPVLQDGDVTLTESMACNLYLARKHGGPIGPQDASEDGLMMQWSFYAATAIEPDALTILYLHNRGTLQSAEDTGLVAEAATRLVRPLKVVNDHLAIHGHLVGDRFTVADLNMAEVLRYAQGHHELMGQFAAIQTWLTACQQRPAFVAMSAARDAEPA
jgi:glutathione S-transferase